MKLCGLMAIVALLLGPSGAGAQGPLEAGDRVRIRLVGGRDRIVARVTEVGPDSLTLTIDYVLNRRTGPCTDRLIGRCGRDRPEADGESLRVGIGEFSEVERSVGTRPNTRSFAVGAGLVGGIIGAIAFGGCRECYPEWWKAGAVLFGVPSLFLGGIVGSLVSSEDWREVSGEWSEQHGVLLRSAVFPRPGGGVTLAWSMPVPWLQGGGAPGALDPGSLGADSYERLSPTCEEPP